MQAHKPLHCRGHHVPQSQAHMAQDVPTQSHSTATNTCVAHPYRPTCPAQGPRGAQRDVEACLAQKLRSISPHQTWPASGPQELRGRSWSRDTGPLEEEDSRAQDREREAVPAQDQLEAATYIGLRPRPSSHTGRSPLPISLLDATSPRSPSHSCITQETG